MSVPALREFEQLYLTLLNTFLIPIRLLFATVVSAIEGWYPDEQGLNACQDDHNEFYNQTYYLFNKEGMPKASDLKASVNCKWIARAKSRGGS
jgi:hypothetical protein